MIENCFSLHKTPSIAAPFRRQLFEPYDQIIYNPVTHANLRPQNISSHQEPTPIIDEQGNELYRLSDVRKMIEEDIMKKEEEIQKEFSKSFKDDLVNIIKTHNQNSSNKKPPDGDSDKSIEDNDSKNMFF